MERHHGKFYTAMALYAELYLTALQKELREG